MNLLDKRALALLPLALVSAVSAADSSLKFVDATAASGIRYRNVCGAAPEDKGWLSESLGAGAAWLDYDGDGNLDLYVVNGSTYDRKPGEGEPNRMYRGDGKGGFVDVTEKTGTGDRGWGFGVAVGDIDNDGDPDLYVTNMGPNVLYRNNGNGTFTAVERAGGAANGHVSTSAAFFDKDNDGDLDLYVANFMDSDPGRVPRGGTPDATAAGCQYRGVPVACGPLGLLPQPDALYENDGRGNFTDVSEAAGIALRVPRFALAVVTADFDNDGDQDVYVANDSVPNSLWQNRGQGKFVDVGVGTLAALNAHGTPQAGRGADFGDLDGDGFLDLVVSNFSQDVNTIYRSMGGRFFVDSSGPAGMAVTWSAMSWGAGFHDLDLDGDLDLFFASGHAYPQIDDFGLGSRFKQANLVFVNEAGRFREVGASSGPGLALKRSFRGAAFADYDNDGDMDVFVTALDEGGLLLRNDSRRAGHFLTLRLLGGQSGRDPVGTRVAVTAGGVTRLGERKGGGSYLSGHDPRLHFGLGASQKAEVVQVRWPSGVIDTLRDVALDRVISVSEGRGLVP